MYVLLVVVGPDKNPGSAPSACWNLLYLRVLEDHDWPRNLASCLLLALCGGVGVALFMCASSFAVLFVRKAACEACGLLVHRWSMWGGHRRAARAAAPAHVA